MRALAADSPLCQGLLTGKYSPANRPTGPRAQLFTDQRYKDVEVGRGWGCCWYWLSFSGCW